MVVHLEISTYVLFAFMITSKHFCVIFQSLMTMKKKIKITCSLTSNLSLFFPASREGNFLALPSKYEQKNRLKDLFELLSYSVGKNLLIQDNISRSAQKKKKYIFFFPTRLATVLIRLRKTLPFPYFLSF